MVDMTLALAFALLTTPAANLEANVRSVLPTPAEEKWLQIPWRTNLVAARAEAQQLGKPMFLWIMNGSPLGCT
jgi:hypothetical protein